MLKHEIFAQHQGSGGGVGATTLMMSYTEVNNAATKMRESINKIIELNEKIGKEMSSLLEIESFKTDVASVSMIESGEEAVKKVNGKAVLARHFATFLDTEAAKLRETDESAAADYKNINVEGTSDSLRQTK